MALNPLLCLVEFWIFQPRVRKEGLLQPSFVATCGPDPFIKGAARGFPQNKANYQVSLGECATNEILQPGWKWKCLQFHLIGQTLLVKLVENNDSLNIANNFSPFQFHSVRRLELWSLLSPCGLPLSHCLLRLFSEAINSRRSKESSSITSNR